MGNQSSSSSSKRKDYIDDSASDPCKKFGCRFQACMVDALNRPRRRGDEVNVDIECQPEREALEQCRKEHGLLVTSSNHAPNSSPHKK